MTTRHENMIATLTQMISTLRPEIIGRTHSLWRPEEHKALNNAFQALRAARWTVAQDWGVKP